MTSHNVLPPPRRRETSSPEYDPDPGSDQELAQILKSSPQPAWDSDIDTDGINSISSDELYLTRPNRYRGPTSNWLRWTEEERKDADAIDRIRAKDLAAHLYNAHALKHRKERRPNPGEGGDGGLDAMLQAHDTDWKPPNVWTAWPMSIEKVPGGRDDVAKAEELDHVQEGVFRSAAQSASEQLEELVSATMLRLAKERFLRRGLHRVPEDETAASGKAGMSGRTGVTPGVAGLDLGADQDDEMDMGVGSASKTGKSKPRKSEPKTYIPVVSADDDLSYKLLSPSARHILTKLDQTLAILHHSRAAGVEHRPRRARSASVATSIMESSASSYEPDPASDAEPARGRKVRKPDPAPAQQQQVKRPRGRPRSTAPMPKAAPKLYKSGKRRGRPPKAIVPKEGETEAEAQIRHARERHMRIPVLPSVEGQGEASEPVAGPSKQPKQQPKSRATSKPDSRSKAGKHAETEGEETEKGASNSAKKRTVKYSVTPEPGETRHDARVRVAKARHRKVPLPSSGASSSDSEDRGFLSELGRQSSRRFTEFGLRDWSDVLGAAAMAGFPPQAIARATQRCASLFGQGMKMDTFAMVGRGKKGRVTTEYLPQPLDQPIVDSETDEEEELRKHVMLMRGMHKVRSRSRASSRSRVDATTDDDNDDDGNRPKRRRRASSARLRGQNYYCTQLDCPRAIEGFARRANMVRHMKLVHGIEVPKRKGKGSGAASGGNDTESAWGDEDDIDTEMEDGLHDDGFLRPIKVKSGWRGPDLKPRKRRTKAEIKSGTPAPRSKQDKEDGDMELYGP